MILRKIGKVPELIDLKESIRFGGLNLIFSFEILFGDSFKASSFYSFLSKDVVNFLYYRLLSGVF